MIASIRIEKALLNANLEGFTTALTGNLKRYIVANTHNKASKIDNQLVGLLSRQAMTLFLAYDNVNVGGWQDSETKKVYIDISTSFDNLKDAIEFAKETKQIAIWDNKELKEIRVEY